MSTLYFTKMELISNTIFLVCFALFVTSSLTFTSTHEVRQPTWEEWKHTYGKTYETVEKELAHKKIWTENVLFVEKHNQRLDVSFKVELNSLADQVISRPTVKSDNSLGGPIKYKRENNSPKSWDWRTKGAVSPVKNQGQLGDVLSFVVTECVESLHAIQTGQLTILSEAETRDCCVKRPIVSDNVFDCIRDIGGLCSQADYPKPVGKCMNNSCSAVAKVSGGKSVPKDDEDALKDAVYTVPVMAVIDASHVSFQLYQSGIYSEKGCSSTSLDHAVQVVGYGSMNGQDYWICKNSWGENWGMKGYVLIARNKGNMCGIATMASYPV